MSENKNISFLQDYSPIISSFRFLDEKARKEIVDAGSFLLPAVSEKILGLQPNIEKNLETSAPYLELVINIGLWSATHKNGEKKIKTEDVIQWAGLLKNNFEKIFYDGLSLWNSLCLGKKIKDVDNCNEIWFNFINVDYPMEINKRKSKNFWMIFSKAIGCSPIVAKEIAENFLAEDNEDSLTELNRVFRTLAVSVMLGFPNHCSVWNPDAVFASLKEIYEHGDTIFSDHNESFIMKKCDFIKKEIQSSLGDTIVSKMLQNRWKAACIFSVETVRKILQRKENLLSVIRHPETDYFNDIKEDIPSLFVNVFSFVKVDNATGSKIWQKQVMQYDDPLERKNELWIFFFHKLSGNKFYAQKNLRKPGLYEESKAKFFIRCMKKRESFNWEKLEHFICWFAPWEPESRKYYWSIFKKLQEIEKDKIFERSDIKNEEVFHFISELENIEWR